MLCGHRAAAFIPSPQDGKLATASVTIAVQMSGARRCAVHVAAQHNTPRASTQSSCPTACGGGPDCRTWPEGVSMHTPTTGLPHVHDNVATVQARVACTASTLRLRAKRVRQSVQAATASRSTDVRRSRRVYRYGPFFATAARTTCQVHSTVCAATQWPQHDTRGRQCIPLPPCHTCIRAVPFHTALARALPWVRLRLPDAAPQKQAVHFTNIQQPTSILRSSPTATNDPCRAKEEPRQGRMHPAPRQQTELQLAAA